MTGKAKPKKHTAKEIQAKIDAVTTNRVFELKLDNRSPPFRLSCDQLYWYQVADRTGQEKGGHAKFECPHCKTTAPDVTTMQIHHDSKHPKIPFDESKITNLHALLAPSTESKPRPGVLGSLKK